jgi:hypothetical protein
MSEKSPYEIRLELVKIAKDILVESYHLKLENSKLNWEVARERAISSNEIVPHFSFEDKFPSEDQIIEKAKKLNDFISNPK